VNGRGDPPAITFRGVTKRYGGQVALEPTDLEIEEGEFFCLLGPSGCGKTTTLNLVGGFVAPTSGEILIRGANVNRLPPYRRAVNTVFQNYAVSAHDSARQRRLRLEDGRYEGFLDPSLRPFSRGALFAFTLSLDEFIITLFLIGSHNTLPIYIYTQVKFGITPEVNALAALLLAASLCLIALAFVLPGIVRRALRLVPGRAAG